MTIEFVDRYSALGIARPDPATVCYGPCEGVGVVPICDPERKGRLREAKPERAVFVKLWHEQHRKTCCPTGVVRELWKNPQLWYWRSVFRDIIRFLRGRGYCDGWHFVTCPDCDGTGRRDLLL